MVLGNKRQRTYVLLIPVKRNEYNLRHIPSPVGEQPQQQGGVALACCISQCCCCQKSKANPPRRGKWGNVSHLAPCAKYAVVVAMVPRLRR